MEINFAGKHVFEEIMDHVPDKNVISSYKTLKLIDLIKGCLNPETEIRVWGADENHGVWVQYKIPHAEEGRLLVSLFYSHVPGDAGEAAYAVLYGNENPGIASKIPDGPLREIILNSGGGVAIDVKHIVIDGEDRDIMCVLGKGWQLDPLDKRTAKVIMLLLGYRIGSDDWPIIWANYSMGRLIAAMSGYGDQVHAVPVSKDGIASRNSIALRLADAEPIICLDEVLA